ncbi:MAG: molecular chaperone DnaK, partial [Thermoplasmatota archaeon]
NGLNELRKALSGDDTDKIKKKTDELNEILQKVSINLYQKAAQKSAYKQAKNSNKYTDENSWSGHPTDDDKTINADYKVKDDKNNKNNKK